MDLKKRIDDLERRLTPEQRTTFNIHVPPESVQTREEWLKWSDEIDRAAEGIVTTFTIELAHGGGLDDEAT